MAASTIGAGFLTNPLIASLSPDQQQSLVQLQQRQMMGQALSQQGLTPVDMSNRQVGGVAYHVSPLEGLAKLLQTYEGNKISTDALGQQAQLSSQLTGGLYGTDSSAPAVPAQAPVTGDANTAGLSGLSAGMGAAAPSIDPKAIGAALSATGNAAPNATSTTAGPLTLPGHTAAQSRMLAAFAPQAYAAALGSALSPTDATKKALGAGLDPQSVNAAYINKETNIPLIAGRAGAPMFRQDGSIAAMAPKIPDNAIPIIQNGQITGVTGLPGASGVISQSASARTGGEGSMLPFSGVDSHGNPLPTTSRTAAVTQAGATTPASQAIVTTESGGNAGAVSLKGAQGAWQVMPNTQRDPGFGVTPARDNSPQELDRVGRDYYNAMVSRYKDPTIGAIAYNQGPGATDKWLASGAHYESLPAETRNYVGKVATLTALNSGAAAPQASPGAAPSGAIYSAPPLGAPQAATNQQNELSKKWTDLTAQNQQAQTTTSYLQNIKGLATQAAVGPLSDKIVYLNGLLSAAGISDKATDATTANNLLGKYSNQIVARLGMGPTGSDAARSILQAAYPNSHMTAQAINEASDNLVGANQMVQAKHSLLLPLANKRDPTAYNDAENVFDQNADPRVWQYANIQDPTARTAFAQSVVKQDPKFGQRLKALEKLGVLQ